MHKNLLHITHDGVDAARTEHAGTAPRAQWGSLPAQGPPGRESSKFCLPLNELHDARPQSCLNADAHYYHYYGSHQK